MIRHRDRPVAVERRRDPDGCQQIAHDPDVGDGRHVGEAIHAVGEQRRGHQLEDGVLGSRHDHLAVQRRGAANHNPVGIHGPQVWPIAQLVPRRPPVASWRVPRRTDVAPVVASRNTRGAATHSCPVTTSSKRCRGHQRVGDDVHPARGTVHDLRAIDRRDAVDGHADDPLPHRHPLVRMAVRPSAAQHVAPPAAAGEQTVVVAARSPLTATRRHARPARCGLDVGCVHQHAVHADGQLCGRRVRHRRARPRRRRRDRAPRCGDRHSVRDARRPARAPPDDRRHGVGGTVVVRRRSHRPELLGAGRHPGDRPAGRTGAGAADRRRRHRGDAARTAAPTHSACSRWPAASVPASPWSPCASPISAPTGGDWCTCCR